MLRRLAGLLLLTLTVLFGAGTTSGAMATTTVNASSFTYDGPTVARVGAHAIDNAGATPFEVSDVAEQSAWPLVTARGTSTTPSSRNHATEAVDIGSANFAQKTAGANFSAEGAFAGAPRSQIVGQLQSGALTAADVPVEVIVRNGQTLILNTRSATALAEAGVPRSVWSVVNMTGDAAAEARLTAQLARNGLTDAGIGTVRAK